MEKISIWTEIKILNDSLLDQYDNNKVLSNEIVLLIKIISVNATRIVILSQMIIIFHLETVLLNCFCEHLSSL